MLKERMMGQEIKMEDARKVIEAMLDAAINTPEDPNDPMAVAPMAFAVVDTAGTPVYLVRMDGTCTLNARMAMNKAYSAIDTKHDTVFMNAGPDNTGIDVTIFGGSEPRLTFIPGGVLLRAKDGSIAGAVGTSGRLATAPMGDEELARIGAKAYLDLQG
jgi:uncharacterized protein GlcG (DUF336 family)